MSSKETKKTVEFIYFSATGQRITPDREAVWNAIQKVFDEPFGDTTPMVRSAETTGKHWWKTLRKNSPTEMAAIAVKGYMVAVFRIEHEYDQRGREV